MSTEVKKTAALKVPILPHNSPEAPQPPTLKTPLYPHQLRALHRCLLIENDGSLAKDFGAFHDYKSRGGCLADAVGMGKTATSIGLILSSPRNRGEGDTLVVAPGHLIHQWKSEIEKFTDDIEVIVGRRDYERCATLPPTNQSHRVVLMDVDSVMSENKLWYNWRRVYSDKGGYERRVSLATMEEYKKAALFCVKSPRGPCSYEGYVYTGPLHHPFRPWRRVIFDEIQDLVSEGTESQKNLLQLSRTAKNVWLLSATPFPHGNMSVYANHELLGFCRFRMDVEVDHELGSTHPFEIIKRKLYIRSPKHVADDAVTASQKVTRDTIYVEATTLERKFFDLEKNDIVSRNTFGEQYDSLRQMMVHPEASKKLREQINGKDENTRGGKKGKAVQQKNKRVGRFATVNSFARHSLDTAKARYKELERVEIPQADRDSELVRSSWYLALKIRQVRASAVMSNPFARQDEPSSTPLCIEVEEAKAIHQYYCRCPYYRSNDCEADDKCRFQTIGRGPSNPPVVYKGYKSTQDVIDYFKDEVRPGRKEPHHMGSSELHEYLEVFINRKETVSSQCKTNKDKLIIEQVDLQTRIHALEETVKVGNTMKNMSKDEELAERNGSKCAALIQFLWEVEEKGEQAIVFSYWHDVLALVQRSLKSNKLSSAFCNGRTGNMMSKTIMDFTSGDVKILLLSAQAKASGANLQVATNVILLDPAGSSAEHGATLEQQAVGRAVRMGQENAVRVIRFCVRDTIEEQLFNDIDIAAAKLITRNNDSTYMCENAHKTLDTKVLQKKKKAVEEDDDVCMGESISVKERVARKKAEAEANNEIIVIDDSDDEDGGGKPKANPSSVPMKAPAKSNSSVKVKAERSANAAAIKRGNEAVNTTNTTSPDKRARVESEATPSAASASNAQPNTLWKCDFCDKKFCEHAMALDHERTCEKNSAKDEVQDSTIEEKAPVAASNEEGAKPPEDDLGPEWAKAKEEFIKSCIGEMNHHDKTFLNMVLELKKVKESTGVAWVPGKKCILAKWCAAQRKQYSNHLRGKTKALNQGRIDLLNHLGFLWGNIKAAKDTPKKQPVVTPKSKTRSFVSTSSEAAVKESTVPSPQVTSGKTEATPAKLQAETAEVISPAAPMEVEQPKEASDEAQATPGKTRTKAADDEERVVSPSVDQMEVSTEAASPSSPPKGSDVNMQTKEARVEAQATPDKAQTETVDADEGRVVSPSVDLVMEVSNAAADEDGLKSLLIKCELGQYLDKFQGIQVTSAPQLLGNLQDLSFMQHLVEETGMSAIEAIKLQILASKQ